MLGWLLEAHDVDLWAGRVAEAVGCWLGEVEVWGEERLPENQDAVEASGLPTSEVIGIS